MLRRNKFSENPINEAGLPAAEGAETPERKGSENLQAANEATRPSDDDRASMADLIATSLRAWHDEKSTTECSSSSGSACSSMSPQNIKVFKFRRCPRATMSWIPRFLKHSRRTSCRLWHGSMARGPYTEPYDSIPLHNCKSRMRRVSCQFAIPRKSWSDPGIPKLSR